jgi:hypothetical protein
VGFWCPDNPTLNITGANALLNNPSSYTINVGTVAKSDPGADGINYFRGDHEYAPFVLGLGWQTLGYNDYLKLASLRSYYVHFNSFRNVGYYGKLVCGNPESAQTKVQDIVKLAASFFVLAPSDLYGGAATCTRVAPPSSYYITASTTGGFIPVQPAYYYLTFSSIYGETTAYGNSYNYTGSTATGQVTVTWTWPSSTAYCTGATLYVNNTLGTAGARQLAYIPNGLTPTWTDYVGYGGTTVQVQPPASNLAYSGQWNAGIWMNEGTF